MEAILSWVKNGLLFAILATVILLMSPNRTYIKHISLTVGLLFILVMIHPVMEWFHLDEKTYIAYIDNLLMLESTHSEISGDQMELYQQSVCLQLKATLYENGYPINEVEVKLDEEGNVKTVCLSFDGEISGVEYIEVYLNNLYGPEVEIIYEK